MTAGEQGGDDLERGIFGGGADQDDRSRFHIGQKGILLGFVEAVDLIDKDDGPAVFAEAGVGAPAPSVP